MPVGRPLLRQRDEREVLLDLPVALENDQLDGWVIHASFCRDQSSYRPLVSGNVTCSRGGLEVHLGVPVARGRRRGPPTHPIEVPLETPPLVERGSQFGLASHEVVVTVVKAAAGADLI